MFDGEALGQQMVEIVRGYVAAEIEPLKAENASLRAAVEELKQRAIVVPEPVKGEPGPQGEPGPAGEVDMTAVKELIDAAVAALPPAERGEKGEPGQDGLSGQDGVDGAPGAPGESGKDGIGLADALKDADGNLVLVMTDGRTKSLGPVNGKDGERGPAGFSLEHFNIEGVSERTVRFSFSDATEEVTADVTIPSLIGRGIWSTSEDYERGDVVTWGGTAWEAVEPVKGTKPDNSSGGWRILAKRGRDGKDAGK